MRAGASESKFPAARFQLGYGDYLRFRELVLERSGLHFPEKKKADLEAGMAKALAESSLVVLANGQYDLDTYYHLLRDKNNPTGRTEMERLISTLTIGETYFFRDQAQFNALATQVLPALIARKRAAAAADGPMIQPQLRIWSAGCATGEEPYSLAILLKELLPDIANWHILLLATDINPDSLVRARESLYSEWSFREARAKNVRPQYFTRDTATNRYRLHDSIRQMVNFAYLNLIEDDYPSIQNNTVSMDLILCRNVTIYFPEDVTRRVVQRFYDTLIEGGWLVVGHSEPSLVVYRAFQARTFPDTLLYQKTGQPHAWPAEWEWLDKATSQPPPATPATKPLLNSSANGNFFSGKVDSEAVIKPSTSPLSPSPASLPSAETARGTKPLPPSGADPYALAKVLLNKGDIDAAITELKRKLAVTPDFAPAHSLLGLSYANMGRWAEARRWCQSALKLDGLIAEAYYVLALIHQHENQIELAIEMLKKAIYLEREAPLPHFTLVMLHKKLGQIELARRTCRNVIRILEKWSPDRIIPDSGGVTARRLLETCRRLLNEL